MEVDVLSDDPLAPVLPVVEPIAIPNALPVVEPQPSWKDVPVRPGDEPATPEQLAEFSKNTGISLENTQPGITQRDLVELESRPPIKSDVESAWDSIPRPDDWRETQAAKQAAGERDATIAEIQEANKINDEIDPIFDLSAKDLADVAENKENEFDLVSEMLNRREQWTPEIQAKVSESFRILNERRRLIPTVKDIVESGMDLPTTITDWVGATYLWAKKFKTGVVGESAPSPLSSILSGRAPAQATPEEKEKIRLREQKAVGEATAASVSSIKHFGTELPIDMIEKILGESPTKWTPEKSAEALANQISRNVNRKNILAGGGGEFTPKFSPEVRAEMKAGGLDIDPAESEKAEAGDPFSLIAIGPAFKGIGAVLKVPKAVFKSATRAGRGAATDAAFIATAPVELQGALLGAVEREAAKRGVVGEISKAAGEIIGPAARKVDDVLDAAGKFVPSAQTVVGKSVQSVGVVADTFAKWAEKVAPVAVPLAGAVSAAGAGGALPFLGQAVAAVLGAGGTLAYGVRPVMATLGAIRKQAQKLGYTGKSIAAQTAEEIAETPIRGSAAAALKGAAQSVPGVVEGAVHGAALDLSLAALTTLTSDNHSALQLGAALGVASGLRSGLIRTAGEVKLGGRDWGHDVAVPTSGTIQPFESMSTAAYAAAPRGIQRRVNALRQLLKGLDANADMFMSDPARREQRQISTTKFDGTTHVRWKEVNTDTEAALITLGFSKAQAEFYAGQNGWFDANVQIPGQPGKTRRVIVVNDVDSAPHEAKHAFQNINGELANQVLDRVVRDSFNENMWDFLGRDYTEKLLQRRLRPDESWADLVLEASGDGISAADLKLKLHAVEELQRTLGREATADEVRALTPATLVDGGIVSTVDAQGGWRNVLTPAEKSQAADKYIAREISAETFDAVFKHFGPAMAEKGGLISFFAKLVAATTDLLGGDSLRGRTSEVLGVPLKAPIVEEVTAQVRGRMAEVAGKKPVLVPKIPAPKGMASGAPPGTPQQEADKAKTVVENAPDEKTGPEVDAQSPREILGVAAEVMAERASDPALGSMMVDYRSAPGTPAGVIEVMLDRSGRREQVEIGRNMSADQKILWEKLFTPAKVAVTKEGEYQVQGLAQRVLGRNAVEAAKFLAEINNTGLSPFEIDVATQTFTESGWQKLFDKIAIYNGNQAAGLTGKGTPLEIGRAREFGFYEPTGNRQKVGDLTDAEMNFINYLFGYPLPGAAKSVAVLKRGGKAQYAEQLISEATEPGKAQPLVKPRTFGSKEAEQLGFAGEQLLEVNPLRAQIEQAARDAGIKPPSPIDVWQNLNLKDIVRVQKAPELPSIAGNEIIKRAGFSPKQLVTPEIEKRFARSAVRFEDGTLKPVFHATVAEFDPAAINTDAFQAHFGSPSAAAARVLGPLFGRNEAAARNETGSKTMPVFLDIKNPLLLRDIGNWESAYDVATALYTKFGAKLPRMFKPDSVQSIVDSFVEDRLSEGIEEGKAHELSNAEEINALKQWIEDQGYDGIVYANEFEAPPRIRGEIFTSELGYEYGQDSYIPFSNDQIHSAIGPAKFSPSKDRKEIELVGPDGKKYRAMFDGYMDMSLIGLGQVPQITPLENLPGSKMKGSTTYGPSLEKAGYQLPADLPAPVIEGAPATEAQFSPPKKGEEQKPRSGLEFKKFFSDVASGRFGKSDVPFESLQDLSDVANVEAERMKHWGNFENHIQRSIPMIHEEKTRLSDGIIKTFGADGARLLDIGSSEGDFGKAISALTDGKIETVSLDPNPDMAADFRDISTVEGATFTGDSFLESFEGHPAHSPSEPYDIVNEAVTFQFINPNRDAQVAEVKRMLTPDGIFLSAEKFKTDKWTENEAKKDKDFKDKYFTKSELAEKETRVGFQQSKEEQQSVGMVDNMVSDTSYIDTLQNNFKHVIQYWDSGNFKGFAASDNLPKLRELVSNIGDLNSEFSTVRTPREVSFAPKQRANEEKVTSRIPDGLEIKDLTAPFRTHTAFVSPDGVIYDAEGDHTRFALKYLGFDENGGKSTAVKAVKAGWMRVSNERSAIYVEQPKKSASQMRLLKDLSVSQGKDVIDDSGKILFSVEERGEAQFAPRKRKEADPLKFIKGAYGSMSKAWILPNGKVEQLGAQWHHHWLSEHPEIAERYKLDVPAFEGGDTEGVREAALQKGFARVNFDGNALIIEAREKDWRTLRPIVEDMIEKNLDDIDKFRINLLDDEVAKLTKTYSERLFDAESDRAKMGRVYEAFSEEARNERGAAFSPKPNDPLAIKMAAVRDDTTGEIFTGVMHPVIVSKLAREGRNTDHLTDGFVTNAFKADENNQLIDGEFLNRDDTFYRALDRKQVDPKKLRPDIKEFGMMESTGFEKARKFSPPKREQFEDPETIREALSGPGWAIITGTQEALGKWNAPANLEANKALEADLREKGYEFTPIKGNYKGVPQGTDFLVTDISIYDAQALGKKYKQESVLTPKGLLYGDGTITPGDTANTLLGAEARKQEFFSTLPNGLSFSVPLDFSKAPYQPVGEQSTLFGGREYESPANFTQAELRQKYPEAIIPKKSKEKIGSDIVGSPLYKESANPVQAFADKLVEFVNQYKDDPVYQLGLRWYSDFVPMLKKEYGADAPMMAQLLAASSPNEKPKMNFFYANDAIEGFKSGRFDKIISKFNQGFDMYKSDNWLTWYNRELKAGNIVNPPQTPTPESFLANWIYKHDLKPKQSNGQLYGFHGRAILEVMAGKWLQENKGPKVGNFIQNLLGAGHEATIDVWADRTMRRIGYADTKNRWRIMPANVKGVSDADFAFSQKAVRAAAERLGVLPDALQGGLWFAEKRLWAENGWGREDLGSYVDEMANLTIIRQAIKQRLTATKGRAKVKPMETGEIKFSPKGAGERDVLKPGVYSVSTSYGATKDVEFEGGTTRQLYREYAGKVDEFGFKRMSFTGPRREKEIDVQPRPMNSNRDY